MSPADAALAAPECFHCGDYESVHLFAEAAEKDPSTEILNDLGYAQQTCGHMQEAERSFREALTIAPDNTQAPINLGALPFNKGKIEAAAHWLERASPRSKPLAAPLYAAPSSTASLSRTC
jgi:Flp pilus assembly protein TadD